MTQCTTIYDHTNPAHRELKVWRQQSTSSWQTTAKRYARAHGEAKVWKVNDTVVRYWLDDGKIRQRTYHKVMHA